MYQKEYVFIKNLVVTLYESIIEKPVEIMDKGHFDTVTSVDYAMEKALIEAIKKAFPTDSVISEEFNPDGKVNGRTWVIDPIDGTVNFARYSVHFGVQIALFDHNEVVLSYIYLPKLKEEYYAILGQGAYKNNELIKVSPRPLNQTILTFSDFMVDKKASNEFVTKLFFSIKDHIFRTRILGSSAIDFTSLVSGITDALMVRTNYLWDLAPGYLLAKEAGCHFTNEKGGTYKFTDFALFAFANPEFGPFVIKHVNNFK